MVANFGTGLGTGKVGECRAPAAWLELWVLLLVLLLLL